MRYAHPGELHSSAWPADMVEARESETLVSLGSGQSQPVTGNGKGQKGQERRQVPCPCLTLALGWGAAFPVFVPSLSVFPMDFFAGQAVAVDIWSIMCNFDIRMLAIWRALCHGLMTRIQFSQTRQAVEHRINSATKSCKPRSAKCSAVVRLRHIKVPHRHEKPL